MKIYKLIAVCLAISSISFAQTTVTARILPIPGDTITFVVHTNFSSVKVTPPGIERIFIENPHKDRGAQVFQCRI